MTTATTLSAAAGLASNAEGCGPHCARLCTDDGLAEAMRANRGLLHWKAANSLGDPGLAEQAVQETFLRAWRACSKFDERSGTVRAWLLAIGRNLVIDIARSRALRPGDTHWEDVGDLAGGHRTADFSEGLAESWFVEELLANLPESQREALAQVILHDRPYLDVANELGVPVGTLKSRVHYGLRTLRGHLSAA